MYRIGYSLHFILLNEATTCLVLTSIEILLQIVVYENGVEKAKYNVLEEVKDLWFDAPYLFTVRDLDVTVTEIKPGETFPWYFSSSISR